MLRFIVRRLIVGLGILLISSFIMYMLTDFSMDYLADLRQSTDPNKEFLIAERIRLLDLETPAYLRYFKWLGNFVTGDLGTAWTTQRSVTSLLSTAIASTLQLVTAATFLAIFLGVESESSPPSASTRPSTTSSPSSPSSSTRSRRSGWPFSPRSSARSASTTSCVIP